MRRLLTRGGLLAAGVALVAGLVTLWLAGGLDPVAAWLAEAQRAAQDRLAGAIRALRGGAPGALAGFWALCLAYGVLHAAGPGHGKVLIGGYGVARRVPLARLAGLALAASLAQALVAVALVYGLVAMLGWQRGAVEDAASDWVTPAGHALIAGLGLWLMWRGGRGLWRGLAPDRPLQGHAHAHDHDHHDHQHGPLCTHAHAPSADEVARVTGWRDAAVLVAGIAMRPCSGALFVLVVTWQLGIVLAGIAGVLIMGLGTGLVTVAVAALAVRSREGALDGLGRALDGKRLARILPLVELAIGTVIAVAALGLLLRAL